MTNQLVHAVIVIKTTDSTMAIIIFAFEKCFIAAKEKNNQATNSKKYNAFLSLLLCFMFFTNRLLAKCNILKTRYIAIKIAKNICDGELFTYS